VSIDDVIDHLCALSFLGVEVNNDDFRFADYPQEYRKNEVLARKWAERRGGMFRYIVHSAFRAYLEIVEA
jgi:hypothetical protein